MKKICLLVAKATSALSVCFLSLLIGGATIVRAQERQAGIYFMTIVPQGEFSENVTNNGYGASGQFLVRLAGSPFLAGGDVGIAIYGNESRLEPLSTTIPNLRVRVRTTNNIFLAHFLLRAQPKTAYAAILPWR